MHIRGFDFDEPFNWQKSVEAAVIDAAIILAKHFLNRDPTHEEVVQMGFALQDEYQTLIGEAETVEDITAEDYRQDVWMVGYNMASC